MKQRSVRIATLITAPLLLASLLSGPVEARRGKSFGSRGARTYNAPGSSYGSNSYVPPVQRSMTPRSATTGSNAYNPGTSAQPNAGSRSRFGGFGGGLLGGLVAGGLIGHFMGNGGGWGASGGGGGGFLISLIQIAVVGLLIWMAIGFFRRRRALAGPQVEQQYSGRSGFAAAPNSGPWGGGGVQQSQPLFNQAPPPAQQGGDIALTQGDQIAFEHLLIEVQDAFGHEDYRRLRALTTPEIMSYLAEELSENATQNRRNEVTGTKLIDAQVVEAWEEASGDYATIALHYESIDLMRDRTTGAILEGSASTATRTRELWTFFRDNSGIWKLSAIQES